VHEVVALTYHLDESDEESESDEIDSQADEEVVHSRSVADWCWWSFLSWQGA
jgi:hypothetical protein